MRRCALIFAALGSLSVALYAQQAARPQVRPIDPGKAEIKIQRLSSNVYMLQAIGVNGTAGNFGGNATAFVGDDGIVLIDAGFFNMEPKLEAALKTISDKPAKYVLNTHWHADHTEGDAPLARTATIVAQDNVRTRMQTGSAFRRLPWTCFRQLRLITNLPCTSMAVRYMAFISRQAIPMGIPFIFIRRPMSFKWEMIS